MAGVDLVAEKPYAGSKTCLSVGQLFLETQVQLLDFGSCEILETFTNIRDTIDALLPGRIEIDLNCC